MGVLLLLLYWVVVLLVRESFWLCRFSFSSGSTWRMIEFVFYLGVVVALLFGNFFFLAYVYDLSIL